MEKFDTVVEPVNGWFNLHLKDVWRYRDLILLFVKRNFVAQYKQTILGPSWAIIQPLLTTFVFSIVFGNIAGLAAPGVPTFVFYLCGTVAWQYFSGCLSQTAGTFISYSGILGKVYFPRLVVPIASVTTVLISFGIQFGMFLVFWVYYWYKGAIHPNWFVLMLPLLILHMAAMGMGFGIIISALTTKYRDLMMLIGFGLQLWMYATPVAYDINLVAARIPAKFMPIYMMNPMTPVINTFRYAFLGLGSFEPMYYMMSWCVTFFVLALGVILFSRVEKTFMDTI